MIMQWINNLSDYIGLVGVALLLIAFYLLNINRLSAKHLGYQILNFLGSGLILVSLFFDWNLSAVVIEVAWMFISLIGIYNIYQKN